MDPRGCERPTALPRPARLLFTVQNAAWVQLLRVRQGLDPGHRFPGRRRGSRRDVASPCFSRARGDSGRLCLCRAVAVRAHRRPPAVHSHGFGCDQAAGRDHQPAVRSRQRTCTYVSGSPWGVGGGLAARLSGAVACCGSRASALPSPASCPCPSAAARGDSQGAPAAPQGHAGGSVSTGKSRSGCRRRRA